LRKPATSAACLSLLAICMQAGAHEGHGHDEEPVPVAVAAGQAVPQGPPDAPGVEAVARREGGDVVLYLDDYASNAPLDELVVSVRSGSLTVQATGGEGRYRIPADLLPSPGPQRLELALHGGGIDEQLQVELPAASAAAPSAPTSWSTSRWLGLALIAPLLSGAWLLRRRRGARAAPGVGAA